MFWFFLPLSFLISSPSFLPLSLYFFTIKIFHIIKISPIFVIYIEVFQIVFWFFQDFLKPVFVLIPLYGFVLSKHQFLHIIMGIIIVFLTEQHIFKRAHVLIIISGINIRRSLLFWLLAIFCFHSYAFSIFLAITNYSCFGNILVMRMFGMEGMLFYCHIVMISYNWKYPKKLNGYF